MNLESLSHQLLGLGERWEVVSLRVDGDPATVEIGVRETGSVWSDRVCPEDGEALAPHGSGFRGIDCRVLPGSVPHGSSLFLGLLCPVGQKMK